MECTRYVYGIYYDGEIVYTGSTNNMKKRWKHYRRDHINTESRSYDMKICELMREKGFDNFSHEIIETFHDITKQDLTQYEGMWQQTFTELGFNLLNKLGAGNGRSCDLNSITYHNKKARERERISCDLCGAIFSRGAIRRHQKRSNCLNNRKVLSS